MFCGCDHFPDNNTAGVLYFYMPLAWLVVTIILVEENFFGSIVPGCWRDATQPTLEEH